MNEKGIKLTYFPSEYKFPESLKKELIEFSEKPERGSLVYNYKTLVLHF